MPLATSLAIAGLAITAGTTAVSFTQAAKQGKMQKKAEADAQKYMADARKKLEVNFYEQLGIQKEPYELEREALLSAGAQAIEAGVESERGAASTAGRVQMAQQEGQRKIAGAMGQELLGLEKLAVAEESRLRDTGVNLDLATVQGAQIAARDAEQAKALATKQGIQGVTSMANQALALFPLYSKTASAREFGKFEKTATGQYGISQPDVQKNIAALGTVQGVDFSKVATMNPLQFKDFMATVDPNILKQINANLPNTIQSFNPNSNGLSVVPPQYNFDISSIGGIK